MPERDGAGRRGSRWHRSAVTAAAVVSALIATAPAGAAAPPEQPPALQALQIGETIYFDEIPVPAGVTVTGVDLAPDAEHWVLGIEVDGADQLAVMRPDGSAYRCLTCGLASSAQKEEILEDEQRIWFADTSGQASGALADFQWSMLECQPSIYECDQASVLPVDFPIDSLSSRPVGAQNREATPDESGEYVVWNEVRVTEGTRVTVGRLERRGGEYVVTAPRVVQPPFRLSRNPADWVAGGRFYEGGKFVLGNRYVKYQTTRTALNYDTGLLDLRTGRYRFMTRDLDYNETGEASPDGRWYSYSSARGLDRMDVFTQLQRPSFLDMAAFGQIGRVGLFGNRRCMNEAWLMGFEGQQPDGYGGQPLLTEDDWLARKREWYPDSRTILLTEQLLPNVADGVPEGRQYRLRVVRLPGRAGAALAERPLSEVDWNRISVPASRYRGLLDHPVGRRVVPGRASGTAVLQFRGDYASGSWRVRYRNYSDDGRTTISGTESIRVPSALVPATYDVDLRSRGARTGNMRGHLSIDPRGTTTGDLRTQVDGETWEGVPTQDDCPGMRRPALRVEVEGGSGRTRTVTVSARVAEDSRARPVRGALVTAGDRHYRTDGRGQVRLEAGAGTVSAVTAGGFRDWPGDPDPSRPTTATADSGAADPAPQAATVPMRDAAEDSSALDGAAWLVPLVALAVGGLAGWRAWSKRT